jgi:protein-tyrosine phosphatase
MPELVRLRPGELPGREVLHRTAEAARRGEVVAFPTDTVYGLATSALNREGLGRIYRIKGRDPGKPLPLLAASSEEARRWVEWTPQAEALARRFWPGGLTLVLQANAAGRGLPCRQSPTLAVRVPAHPVALALLDGTDAPWAQTSANDAGQPPLADGAAVARRFGEDLAFVFDSGPAAGRESSVVDATAAPVRVLREGAISARDILAALDRPRRYLFVCTGNSCRSVMAEFLFNKLSRDRGLGLQALSAGVAPAHPAFPLPEGVRAALAAEGIASVQHIPAPVTRELMDWADQVLVMERRHREMLITLFPDAALKVATLRGAEDVSDPIGQSEAVYADCCRIILAALETILGRSQEEPDHASHA